ncbi:MAG: hypothetical protein KAS66_08335 [Candidatus Omnitrophica bacterium]|nr:hypothetical protein [Candidatus Omnitrophota bacterium]
MDLNPFTFLDKVIHFGQIERSLVGCQILPKESYSKKIVVRKGINTYSISYNRELEQAIYRMHHSDLSNRMRRIYDLAGTREPYVVEKLLNRLSFLEPMGDYSDRWNLILKDGRYSESPDEASRLLDYLIHEGLLEYDCEGYYSPNSDWVTKIKKNRVLSKSKASGLLRSNDPGAIETFLSSLGYRLDGEKYRLNDIGVCMMEQTI